MRLHTGAFLAAFLATSLLSAQQHSGDAPDSATLNRTLDRVSTEFAKLQPQSIRPAAGYIKYDYLVPAGYYPQMWDWDGFFIGVHLAHQSPEQAKYLKWWVLNFAQAIDAGGYVSGVITADGPKPPMGKFAMKPFLAQGAVIASNRLGDYQWVAPIWQNMRRVIDYRERTQYDPKWGLFFWDSALQSGADNNVALTNDPQQRSTILAADLCTFQLREYRAMAVLATRLGKPAEAAAYRGKAARLRSAMLRHLWFPRDQMFYNVSRSTGQPIRRISYSNFVPLIEDIVPANSARQMIRRYLWNSDYMLSDYGLRSLAKNDPGYNNVSMIDPYSNWQGPIWINANYLDFIALKRYGFNKEAAQLSATLGRMVLADIEKWKSMHECYSAETGEGLAPTPEQSPGGRFTGFVGWDLLAQDMLQCAARSECETLKLDDPSKSAKDF